MATVKCAISGIIFRCEYLPFSLSKNEGYFHPIFALPHKKLLPLYSKHCQGHLTPTDSYLTFLAILHSTSQIHWKQPASCNPLSHTTRQLVENNIKQLLQVIEQTNTITLPSFKQPSFAVRSDNSLLEQIPNWIKAWNRNIRDFREGYAGKKYEDSLRKVENKLTYKILSGEEPREYAAVIATWAAKAANFPKEKDESWQKVIRTCFNSEKMFSTPLPILREIKAYCEENIEVGSIHFHTLFATLKEGISRHTDFLGLTPEAMGYTLLPVDSTVQDKELASIIQKAPDSEPSRLEYISDIDFLRARLRYKVALETTAVTTTEIIKKETN